MILCKMLLYSFRSRLWTLHFHLDFALIFLHGRSPRSRAEEVTKPVNQTSEQWGHPIGPTCHPCRWDLISPATLPRAILFGSVPMPCVSLLISTKASPDLRSSRRRVDADSRPRSSPPSSPVLAGIQDASRNLSAWPTVRLPKTVVSPGTREAVTLP